MPHRVIIGNSDAPEIAAELEEMIRAKFPGKTLDIEKVYANPTSGAHAGPDGVAVCFRAIHR